MATKKRVRRKQSIRVENVLAALDDIQSIARDCRRLLSKLGAKTELASVPTARFAAADVIGRPRLVNGCPGED